MRRSLSAFLVLHCLGASALLLGSRVPVHPPPPTAAVAAAARAPAPRAVAIQDWLRQTDDGEVAESLSTVLLALFGGCEQVAAKIATASCDSESCFNDLGDEAEEEMLAIDLLAEEMLFDALKRTGLVAVASSDSDKLLRQMTLLPDAPPPADSAHDGDASSAQQQQLYSVALDPLDASSIVDSNFAVGSIFAVWRAPSLLNVTGRQLVAAGACTYGPRTAITLALADRPSVHEFLLVGDRWVQVTLLPAATPHSRHRPAPCGGTPLTCLPPRPSAVECVREHGRGLALCSRQPARHRQ